MAKEDAITYRPKKPDLDNASVGILYNKSEIDFSIVNFLSIFHLLFFTLGGEYVIN